MRVIKMGTRDSRLAVVQTELVAAAVREALPDAVVELVAMKTTGDKILNKTLDKVGGKGLFVKELDAALRRGDVDLCVHSYKDMPAGDVPDLPVVAVSPREDPRDVLILPKGCDRLDPERPIGSSSQRRKVQLEALYPGQPIAPVRGNILTRLEKLDSGQYGAIVLAAAGIRRLNLWDRVSRVFSPEELLPAGCQGAMAVQGRMGEDYSYLDDYNDVDAQDATQAERAFVETLNCGCGAPVGAFALVEGNGLWLRGMIASADGTLCREEIRGERSQAVMLGQALAQQMLKKVDVWWNNAVPLS